MHAQQRFPVRGGDFRSGWQKCEYKQHGEQRSWEVPALVSAGPGPEVSANPALSQAPKRAGHRKVRQCTEQTWAGGRSQIRQKEQSASVLRTGIFQQFRTGSELVSGDQHRRWVFKLPTCKWVLAKIPQLTVFFFFFFVRNAIFRYSQRNAAFCLLRAGVQMSTASSGKCQVFENCHWVCELPHTISKLLHEAGFIFCWGFQRAGSPADPVSGLNSSAQLDFYFVFVSKLSHLRRAGSEVRGTVGPCESPARLPRSCPRDRYS